MSPGKSFLMWILQISILASFKQEFTRWKREYWTGSESTTNEQRLSTCNAATRREEVHCNTNEQHSADATLTMHHTFLCLTEAFAESAPQCCLQNYVMIRQWHFPWYTVLSTILSLLSMAWNITSLETSCKTCQWARSSFGHSSQRLSGTRCQECQLAVNQDIKSFSKISLIVFLLAHLSLLVSRLTSLVIFAYNFRYYVFFIVGLHWLLVFIAICVGKKFTHTKLTLVLNASLRAYPMVFCFSSSIAKLSFRKKISENFRAFAFVFYGIIFIENTIMVITATVSHSEDPYITFLTKITLPLVFGGFIFGVLFLVVYYKCCHPAKTQHNVASITSNNDTHLLKRGKERNIVKYFVNEGTYYEDIEDEI